MADTRIEFRYTAEDVASAQRMRFLRSKQFKMMGLVWIVSTLFLLISMQFFQPSPVFDRPVILAIAFGYVLVIGVLALVSPYLSYAFSRFWRLPLQLQFNEKTLRLSVVKGKSKGLQISWDQIQEVQENKRVIILHYGEGKKFIILPKTAFGSDQTDPAAPAGEGSTSAAARRFRDILRRRGPQMENAPAAETAQKRTQPDPVLEDEETAD